jgi:hypothetical protein
MRDPSGEIDVVGCEVFDDTDISDARRERALSPSADLKDLSEYAVFQLLAHRAESGVEAFNVADASDETGRFERINQLSGLDMRGRDRLFDECVDTGCGELESEREVVRRGCRNNAVVDTFGNELADFIKDAVSGRGALTCQGRVVDTYEVNAIDLIKKTKMVAPHHTEAYEACPQVRHAPAFATALTDSTTFSRSDSVSDG